MPISDEEKELLDEVRSELDEMRSLSAEFKENMASFNSQVTAKQEAEKEKRVSEIIELAVEANKENVYTKESLKEMDGNTLDIIKNSLNDLLTERAKRSMPDDGSGGFNPNRGSNSGAEMSSYDKIDKLVDIVSHSYGLPIPDDEVKQEVRFEHRAADKPIIY